ncbi:MAG: hypothetical protein RDV00_05665 [Clostridia bacterium]|nr:hypothetical protein [Clostridia bacterium]MDQ7791591.1 hypothetical protein [Clostridia bacterium]
MFWDVAVVFAALITVLAMYNAYRHGIQRTGQVTRWVLLSGLAVMLLVSGLLQRG